MVPTANIKISSRHIFGIWDVIDRALDTVATDTALTNSRNSGGKRMNIFVTLLGLVALLEGGLAFTCATSPAFTRSTTRRSATLEGRQIEGEVQPVNNFVLVRVAETQEQTETGILLTGTAKVKKTEGTVVSVGPGKAHPESGKIIPQPVGPGDGVVYGKYDGTEIDYNGVKHTLIRDDDIMVKFTDTLTLENADAVRDYVLVYAEEEEETEGGLLLAKSSSQEAKPSTGEVVKVGPGRMTSSGELSKMQVEPGDEVKFRDYAGNEVEIDGKEYSVVRMADILAKF